MNRTSQDKLGRPNQATENSDRASIFLTANSSCYLIMPTMIDIDIKEPRFTQPEVIEVTELSRTTLQTWANRGLVDLVDQSPGTGKRRLYRALDIVQLEIMCKLTAFGVSPSRAKEMAEEATEKFENTGDYEPNALIVVRPPMEDRADTVIVSSYRRPYSLGDHHYYAYSGDPEHMTLKNLAGISNRMIVASAMLGVPNGAEAILVIRIGEIIKNVLTRIRLMAERVQNP
jgi:DNA-binding transcriptional MerR regulator